MRIKCPYCGSPDVARILYETPAMTDELILGFNQEKAMLAGHDKTESSPTLQCNDCKKKFGREPVCSIRGRKYQPDDLAEIEFRIGGYFGGYDTIVIRNDKAGRAICVWHMPEDSKYPLYIRACPKREWDALMNTLFSQLYVHEWKLSYEDNNIMDGTQWSFKLTFSDGKKREIYGSNDYPALWDSFMRRFRRFISEAHRKETNPVDVYRFRGLFKEHIPIQNWIREHDSDLFGAIYHNPELLDQFHRYLDRNTDKNLRRNEKHVHDSYLFHCEHCSFEDDIYVGVGMMAFKVYDEIIEKIESGFYGEKWKALYANSPKTIVDIAKALYICSNCGHYMSDYNLGLYVLKDGLSEKELKLAGQEHPDEGMRFVYLYNMMWSKQYYRKIGDYVHRCPSCNKRMHLGGYNDKPICPKCGKNGKIELGRITWD